MQSRLTSTSRPTQVARVPSPTQSAAARRRQRTTRARRRCNERCASCWCSTRSSPREDRRGRAHRRTHGARRGARVGARHAEQHHRHGARRRRRARARRRPPVRPRQVRDARRARHRRLPVDLLLRAAARRRRRAASRNARRTRRPRRRRDHRRARSSSTCSSCGTSGGVDASSAARSCWPTRRTRAATSSSRCMALASLALSRVAWPWLDAVLAIIVALIIAWSGFQILRESIPILVDERAIDARELRGVVIGVPEMSRRAQRAVAMHRIGPAVRRGDDRGVRAMRRWTRRTISPTRWRRRSSASSVRRR